MPWRDQYAPAWRKDLYAPEEDFAPMFASAQTVEDAQNILPSRTTFSAKL